MSTIFWRETFPVLAIDQKNPMTNSGRMIPYGKIRAALMIKDYPFSKFKQKGERSKNLMVIFVIAPLFGFIALLFYLLKYGPLVYWGYVALMLPMMWLFEYLSQKRLNKKLRYSAG